MAKIFLILLCTALILSCNDSNKYSYAISDFRKPLQSHLHRIVTKGIVKDSDSALKHMATDKELVRLALSEHPVLRASAFREMIERKSFNQYDLILNHLDDTAIVSVDRGEFGIPMRMVSDDILLSTLWESRQTRHKIVERVIRNHNYLSAAYSVLSTMEPQDELYPIIKEMVTRPRLLSFEGYELAFDDIEYAIYGLAKFKRDPDILILKKLMLKNLWRISSTSLEIIEKFPHPDYFEVLEEYHNRIFYRLPAFRNKVNPEDFIRALVMQKTENAASLLDTMLTRLPRQTCMPNHKGILNDLVLEIWNNPCPAYASLRQRIRPEAEKLSADSVQLVPVDEIDSSSSGRVITWYN